ncbi:MAG: PEGA domain-containing protein [Spirochaetia bacterium]
MSYKKQKKELHEKNLQIKLKPWRGIPAKTYVPILFLATFFVLALFLFLYPGLHFYGAKVTFKTLPPGIAVYVDNQLIGATPVSAKLKAGERKIRLEKTSLDVQESTLKVNGRLFFSLFFPKKQLYTSHISMDSIPVLFSYLFERYYEASEWYSLSSDTRFPRPYVIKETVDALISVWPDLQERTHVIAQWLTATRDLIQDEESWQEITQSWRQILKNDKEFPLHSDLRTMLEYQTFSAYQQAGFTMGNEAKVLPTAALSRSTFFVEGLSFQAAPGGVVELGKEGENSQFLPNKVFISPFYYMNGYLTRADYTRITKNTLDDQGVFATNLTFSQTRPLIGTINNALKRQGMGDFVAELPSEAQWQYLAETQRIKAMFFEWTRDNYVVYRNLYHRGSGDFFQPYWMRDKVIRGQSIFSGDLPLWYRAGFPADQGSDYIAVRLIIVPVANNASEY